MKSQFTISLVGYTFGGLLAFLSAIRYYVIWPDMDRALFYSLIGVMIMALSWCYSKIKKLQIDLQAVEEYLADKSQ